MVNVELNEQLIDEDSLEAAVEWLQTEELSINVGNIDGDGDCYIESTAGYLLRLVKHIRSQKS